VGREIEVTAASVPVGTVVLWVLLAHSRSFARLKFASGWMRCGRFRSLDTWLRRLPESRSQALRGWIEQQLHSLAGDAEPEAVERIVARSEGDRNTEPRREIARDSIAPVDAWGHVSMVTLAEDQKLLIWSRVAATEGTRSSFFEGLASGLAHDWNNQLSIVSGFCHLLLTQLPEQDPRREMVVAIRDAGARMTWMSRQLQSWGGRGPETRESMVWVEWLDRFFEDYRQRSDHPHALRDITPQELRAVDSRITGDARSLTDLLRSVLEEMLRAKAGSHPLEFRALRAEEASERWPEETSLAAGTLWGWELTDPRRVLEEWDRRRFFEPYQRDASPAGRTGRSGLGLAAAARMAMRLGGVLACRSDAPSGTRVRFTFPAM